MHKCINKAIKRRLKQQETQYTHQRNTHSSTDTLLNECRSTHTLLSASKKLQGDGCLFVRVAVSGVCDTTGLRSLPLRPLIPPIQMKCNGANSIRALPPRETCRIRSHQIPQSLPSIHSCLVAGMGNETMAANSFDSMHTYVRQRGMECDAAKCWGLINTVHFSK